MKLSQYAMTRKGICLIALFVISVLLPAAIQAQDFIFRKDGTKQKVKIVDIDTNGVFYKKWLNQYGSTLVASWQNIDSAQYADGRVAVLAGNGQIAVHEPVSIPTRENNAQVENNVQEVAPIETIPQTSQTETEVSEPQTPPVKVATPAPPAITTPDKTKSAVAETNKEKDPSLYLGVSYLFIKDNFSMKLDCSLISFTFGHSSFEGNDFEISATSLITAIEWNKAYKFTPDGVLWFSPGIGIGYGWILSSTTYQHKTTSETYSLFAAHVHPKIGVGVVTLGVLYSFDDFNFLPLKDATVFTLGLAIAF